MVGRKHVHGFFEEEEEEDQEEAMVKEEEVVTVVWWWAVLGVPFRLGKKTTYQPSSPLGIPTDV